MGRKIWLSELLLIVIVAVRGDRLTHLRKCAITSLQLKLSLLPFRDKNKWLFFAAQLHRHRSLL
jgi:hypothetical protein